MDFVARFGVVPRELVGRWAGTARAVTASRPCVLSAARNSACASPTRPPSSTTSPPPTSRSASNATATSSYRSARSAPLSEPRAEGAARAGEPQSTSCTGDRPGFRCRRQPQNRAKGDAHGSAAEAADAEAKHCPRRYHLIQRFAECDQTRQARNRLTATVIRRAFDFWGVQSAARARLQRAGATSSHGASPRICRRSGRRFGPSSRSRASSRPTTGPSCPTHGGCERG